MTKWSSCKRLLFRQNINPLTDYWLMRVTSSHLRKPSTPQKVGYTTKHFSTGSCSARFLFLFRGQCAKCSGHCTVWSGWCTQVGGSICGQQIILKYTSTLPYEMHSAHFWGKIARLLGCSVKKCRSRMQCEIWESLKLLSVFLETKPHSSDEIEKQSTMWKVNSVNGKPHYLILQSWHLHHTTPVPSVQSVIYSRQ